MNLEICNHSKMQLLTPFVKDGWTCYGYIIETDLPGMINSDGCWFAYKIEDDRILFLSDSSASIRVYFIKRDETVYISDDLDYLAERFDCSLAKDEYNMFLAQGYQFGLRTIFDGIWKLAPCTQITIEKRGISVHDYFYQLIPSFNLNAISHSLRNLRGEEIVLMFSGGMDSKFLANTLQDLKIPCHLVFLDDGRRNRDKNRALKEADKLNLKLNIIEIESDGTEESVIKEKQKYDRHYSVLHYYGAKEIVKRYGDQVVVVNGQGSDTILALGPSEKSLQSLLKRVALNSGGILFGVVNSLLGIIYRKRLIINSNSLDYWISMAQLWRYMLIADTYRAESVVESIVSEDFQLSKDWIKKLSLKRLGFLSGSDNQVVINSLYNAGIKKVYLPFSSVSLLCYSKGLSQSSFVSRVFRPKFCLTNDKSQV